MERQGRYTFNFGLIVPGHYTGGRAVVSTDVQEVSENLAAYKAAITAQDEQVVLSMYRDNEHRSPQEMLPGMLQMARAGLREAGLDGSVITNLTVIDTINPDSYTVLNMTDEVFRLELEGA